MEYKEIEKSLESINLTPYGLNSLMSFANGNVRVKSNGNLKITLELPADVLKKKSVPFNSSDFNIVPLLLFCKHKEDIA